MKGQKVCVRLVEPRIGVNVRVKCLHSKGEDPRPLLGRLNPQYCLHPNSRAPKRILAGGNVVVDRLV